MPRDSIFVSYSRLDKEICSQLVDHLQGILGDPPSVRIFADTSIETGEEWLDRLHQELDRALVVVFLVSRHFVSSKFVGTVEIPLAARAARRGAVKIACLYVRPSTVEHFRVPVEDPDRGDFEVRLTDYQGINDPRMPVMSKKGIHREALLVKPAEEIAGLARAQREKLGGADQPAQKSDRTESGDVAPDLPQPSVPEVEVVREEPAHAATIEPGTESDQPTTRGIQKLILALVERSPLVVGAPSALLVVYALIAGLAGWWPFASAVLSARWTEAIASIADRKACPMYKGLEIKPQQGLIPIGRDPVSKLWEFGHVQTRKVPERKEGKPILTRETGLVLVLLPGGAFRMGAERPNEENRLGSPNVDRYAKPDEGPVHEVTLSAFFISKYEVRQAEWQEVSASNPSRFRYDNVPVEGVSWNECREFCRQVGLSLPTEAQWEYACRAGMSGPYAGTENIDDMGWYEENSGGTTHPVGKMQPNHFGLHDMHGNVWEWCEDVYDRGFYARPEAAGPDPVCTSGSEDRVYRGGSWSGGASKGCRSAHRNENHPRTHRNANLGFRPARPLSR